MLFRCFTIPTLTLVALAAVPGAMAGAAGSATAPSNLDCVPPAKFNDDTVTLFDFTQGLHGWTGNPRIAEMTQDAEGLHFISTGVDPWIESQPVANMPAGERVRLTIRMKSSGDTSGEVFFGPSFSASRSATFSVQPDGEWREYDILLPPQQARTRLRIDPAFGTGRFSIAWVKATPVRPLIGASFSAPAPVVFEREHQVASGPLRWRHNGENWDGYALDVNGQTMAMGHVDAALGILIEGQPQSLVPGVATVTGDDSSVTVEGMATDAGGARWRFSRCVEAHPQPGTLRMTIRMETDDDREVFHLPWVTLFPGLGDYGESKHQAMLPGVEYLEENEPSSSEADFNAEQADRRIVESHKLTLPLMAVLQENRYVGLLWNRSDQPAAVFDSPDRVFHSGAHLMGLWHPGVGALRLENEFDVFGVVTLRANQPVEMEILYLGGEGESLEAVSRHYTALRGLPELPEFSGGYDAAVRLLAAGWLDSDLHEDGLWRHAVWGDSFGPQPAADACAFMLYLADNTDDTALAARLRAAAQRGLERLSPPDHYLCGVSHVSPPVAPLLFGALPINVQRMVEEGRAVLNSFDDEGVRRYHQPDPDRPDYGRTHFADHANGYNAQALEPILTAAAFSGDASLAASGLEVLDRMTEHYAGTVPRGAQTWEMPLHTPDILGSARLIRVYVLGYLLSGNTDYLDQARYWAWTGIPFLYLDPPVDGPIGAYATIAVLGATNWVAPNWIGLPVQWCGLVYRSALHDLALVDATEADFWNTIAAGITRSGLQQTFPHDDEKRRGLLPDFFHLHEQVSDGPAITPGTVQAHLAEAYEKTPFYSVKRIGENNGLVHVPGDAHVSSGPEGSIVLNITPWTEAPYWARLTHVASDARILWNGGAPDTLERDHEFGAVNVRLRGQGILVVE